MNPFDWLLNRKEQLELALEVTDGISQDKCADSLVVTARGNRFYYCIRDKQTNSKRYVSQQNLKSVKKIAEHDYAAAIRRLASKELLNINRLLDIYKSETAFECYDSLHPGRKVLMEPILISDNAFAEKWLLSRSYVANPYPVASEFYSDKGEHVRSKSELIIANALKNHGIPYKYEEALQLEQRFIYPDFTLLRTWSRETIYWEHFGMIDQQQYQQHMMQKIEQYANHGIVVGKNLIVTFESKDMPLSTKLVERLILENFGNEKCGDFASICEGTEQIR